MTQNPTPRRGEHGEGTRKTQEETQKRSSSDATGSTETGAEPERRPPDIGERRETGKTPPEVRAEDKEGDATV
jgi:hypothetical protein